MTDPIEVLVALRRYGLENDRFDACVARAHDVSLAEMKAIDHIQAVGELTPGQLGERLSLRSGAVTAVIDRLEEDHEYLTEGGVFTEDLIETWISYKRVHEIAPVQLRPHPHEFELYYDI